MLLFGNQGHRFRSQGKAKQKGRTERDLLPVNRAKVSGNRIPGSGVVVQVLLQRTLGINDIHLLCLYEKIYREETAARLAAVGAVAQVTSAHGAPIFVLVEKMLVADCDSDGAACAGAGQAFCEF